MLLRDSKALEKLAMENASLFVKVVTKVREFIANLRKAQTDMYGGNEELHDAALKLREALKSLEEVQEVFDNALENSIRNMRDALAEAENAKTRENLDVLEKQAEKEGLQLSEETADEFAKNEKDAAEKALANMSVKDYNRRGWLRTLLTREDASKLRSAVAELFINKNRKGFRLKDGSYAVEVNNKIIFVSGTFENPRYESVLVFNTDNATEMEIIKDQFFGSAAITGLTQKDIERFIKQRRGYGQVYGFNAEDYKASGRRDFGRAMLRNNTKGFGEISQFEVRDGVYTKDEGSVSSRVQGLKFSEKAIKNTEVLTDGYSYDQRFRDIQKACREMSQRELQSYREKGAELDERVRAGLQEYFRRRILSGRSSNRYGNEFALTSKEGNKFKVVIVDATSDEQCSETIQKGLEKFHSSKSETEYIQRMKEAFPHAFKD